MIYFNSFWEQEECGRYLKIKTWVSDHSGVFKYFTSSSYACKVFLINKIWSTHHDESYEGDEGCCQGETEGCNEWDEVCSGGSLSLLQTIIFTVVISVAKLRVWVRVAVTKTYLKFRLKQGFAWTTFSNISLFVSKNPFITSLFSSNKTYFWILSKM